MGFLRKGSGYGIRQVFDPVERMWTFNTPEPLTKDMESAVIDFVRHVQNGRKLDVARVIGPGQRYDALLDSIKALDEGRYRVVVSNRDEVFVFKQTVGTGKAFSLPIGG